MSGQPPLLERTEGDNGDDADGDDATVASKEETSD